MEIVFFFFDIVFPASNLKYFKLIHRIVKYLLEICKVKKLL